MQNKGWKLLPVVAIILFCYLSFSLKRDKGVLLTENESDDMLEEEDGQVATDQNQIVPSEKQAGFIQSSNTSDPCPVLTQDEGTQGDENSTMGASERSVDTTEEKPSLEGQGAQESLLETCLLSPKNNELAEIASSSDPVGNRTDQSEDLEMRMTNERIKAEDEVAEIYASKNMQAQIWSPSEKDEAVVKASSPSFISQEASQVFFSEGSCLLTKAACQVLDEHVTYLVNSNQPVQIQAHADQGEGLHELERLRLGLDTTLENEEEGVDQSNTNAAEQGEKKLFDGSLGQYTPETFESSEFLSLARARVIKAYLLAAGISEEKISCFGFGDAQPAVANPTEADLRKLNRRAVLVYV